MSCESGARAIAKVAAKSGIVSSVSKFAFNVGKAEALQLAANASGRVANLLDKSLGEKAIMGERIGIPGKYRKYITRIVKGRKGEIVGYGIANKPPQAGRPTVYEKQKIKQIVYGSKISHKFWSELNRWAGETPGGVELEIEGYTISRLMREHKDTGISPLAAALFMQQLEQDPKRLKARIKKGNWDVSDIEEEKGLRVKVNSTKTVLRPVKQ